MEKFKGKLAVVTGSSSGIGADLSLRLANHGLIVVGLARRVEQTEELTQKIVAGSGGQIIGRKCDLENESDILESFEWIAKEFGRIHVFVNNGGIMLSNFLIDSTTSDNFRKSFNINVIAACICVREGVKNMRQKPENGHIFIINSILGHRIPDVPYPAFGVYPSTKFALTAMTQTLRQEIGFYKFPIKLTSISPGMTETHLLDGMNQELIADMPKLQPSDISDAIIYALGSSENCQVDEIILNAMF